METETRAPISLSASVGKEIRKLLIDLDMALVDLAARMGENEMWVSRRLRGSVPIDLNDLERIARALHVDIAELFPQREGRLIAVGATHRAPRGGDLTTAHSPLAKRPGTLGPRGRGFAPSKDRTGRIRANLAAA